VESVVIPQADRLLLQGGKKVGGAYLKELVNQERADDEEEPTRGVPSKKSLMQRSRERANAARGGTEARP
jgi:hypothetical protein